LLSVGDEGNAGRDTGTDQPASAGTWLTHFWSVGIGDGVTGSSAANGLTEQGAWARAGGSGLLRLAAWWLPHESGAIERIGGQLTRSERCFIVHGIPEGSMSREISLIWEILAYGFKWWSAL
jgi:hypothetical protein